MRKEWLRVWQILSKSRYPRGETTDYRETRATTDYTDDYNNNKQQSVKSV